MNKKSIIWIVAGAVVVIIIAIVVLGHGGNGSPQQQGPTGTPTTTPPSSPPPGSVYTSSADAFSVQFPGGGTPTITNLTYNSPTAGVVPLTEYKVASDESVNAYYGVYVYHYPASYQFANDYLTTALASFTAAINTKYPGTTIASKTSTQFLGGNALAATLTLSAGTEYGLFTVKGQNAYIISSYGVSQSEYNAFLSSFAFTP